MLKSSCLFFIIVLISVPFVTAPVSFGDMTSSSSGYIMEIHGALFSFGWSGVGQEELLVDGEFISLNTKGLLQPSSTPIESDAGPIQSNTYTLYTNNIGFSIGWSAQSNDRYRPSQSMTVGEPTFCDDKGLNEPSNVSIYGDGGDVQTNPADIYLNNIGFSSLWSPVLSEDYRPSASMKSGAPSNANEYALVSPSIPAEAGSEQSSSAVMFLNNVGFYFGWSANSGETWCPSTSMEIGPSVPLNDHALKVPSSWAIGTENTPPVTSDDYDGLWHNNDFSIMLTAIDNESGVSTTFYRINNGPPENTNVNGQPRITIEGSNVTLEYWSVDEANNEESPHKLLSGIKLDKIPPEIGAPTRIPTGDIEAQQEVTIYVNASDLLSGVKNLVLTYDVNSSSAWLDLPMFPNATTDLHQSTIQPQGSEVSVRYKITAYDYAGNNRTEDNAGQFYVYVVIPEFPSTAILVVFMALTMLAATLTRKNRNKRFG